MSADTRRMLRTVAVRPASGGLLEVVGGAPPLSAQDSCQPAAAPPATGSGPRLVPPPASRTAGIKLTLAKISGTARSIR